MSEANLFQRGLKYVWKRRFFSPEETAAITTIAARCNISRVVGEVLFGRGFVTPDAALDFLFTSEQIMHDPAQLKGADAAVKRVLSAIQNGEKILISGDYDVDGITSTALMLSCLIPIGAQINFFLPHRARDGYGLSVDVVDRAIKSGYRLIITVDNGITAFDAVAHAQAHGIDVVVTDHHQAHGAVPGAVAIVNPCQDGCAYPHKHLAGVGVAYKLMQLLYRTIGRDMPSRVYELLMLGTVADVVPLCDENRFFVRYGLAKMREQTSYALEILKKNSNIERTDLSSTDIGFSIAPQINALGRLDDPRCSIAFLIGSDRAEIESVGKKLGEHNKNRKEIEKAVVDDVIRRINSGVIRLDEQYVIIASSDNWPVGVIGLAAARLVNLFARPVILLHKTDDGLCKGSARSIQKFNMFEALATHSEMLVRFGGHAYAAGLSVHADLYDSFCIKMWAYARTLLTPDDLVLSLDVDAEVTLDDVRDGLVRDLAYVEPFGASNPEPVFYIKQVALLDRPRLLKDVHVRCFVGGSDGAKRQIIFFNRPDIGVALNALPVGGIFDCVATVRENWYKSERSVQLQGLDIAIQPTP